MHLIVKSTAATKDQRFFAISCNLQNTGTQAHALKRAEARCGNFRSRSMLAVSGKT